MQRDMLQLSWEAVLNEEAQRAPGTVPQVQDEDVTENMHRDIEHAPE